MLMVGLRWSVAPAGIIGFLVTSPSSGLPSVTARMCCPSWGRRLRSLARASRGGVHHAHYTVDHFPRALHPSAQTRTGAIDELRLAMGRCLRHFLAPWEHSSPARQRPRTSCLRNSNSQPPNALGCPHWRLSEPRASALLWVTSSAPTTSSPQERSSRFPDARERSCVARPVWRFFTRCWAG
jgi:hypothetical protein